MAPRKRTSNFWRKNAKVSPRLATGLTNTSWPLVNLRTRCPMSFPLNGSMPGWILPKPIFVGAFAGHAEAPNPWASASLFGTRLGDFHLGIFRHPWLSWSIFGPPRLSLHAFFFLLCRWKAVFGDGFGEGWMGFPWFAGPEIKWKQHAIASSCSKKCSRTAWIDPRHSWLFHESSTFDDLFRGWLPGFSPFSRCAASARRLLRPGLEYPA